MSRGAPWTWREVENLLAGYAAGAPVEAIAEQLQRSYDAVKCRASKLGLRHPNRRSVAKNGKQRPADRLTDSSVEEIAQAVGKSIPETYAKIHEKPNRRTA